MINSKELAKLIGPTLSVMTLSEAINLHIWATSIPQIVYLNGMLLLIAGISIIRVHNHWVSSWEVVLTLVGWFCLTIGLLRIFFPDAPQADDNIVTYIMIGILCLIGLFLSFKAYSPGK